MKKKVLILAACLTGIAIQSQTVNQFTGELSHSVPLIHVPSKSGNGLDINVVYRAGIKTDQPASEIGLGWGVSAGGEISRSVMGTPDDVPNFTNTPLPMYNPTIAQGSMFLQNNLSYGANDFDMCRARRGIDTIEFISPNYDNFSVQGPGLSGNMALRDLRFYSYANTSLTLSTPYTTMQDFQYAPNTQNLTANAFDASTYFRKPQFQFDNDFHGTLQSRQYPTSPITSISQFKLPTDVSTGMGYTSNSYEPYVGKPINGVSGADQNYDATTGRLATTNFVEYFSNAEVSANASTLSGGPMSPFIDYKTTHTRPDRASTSNPYATGEFPQEGIGYIRVTSPQGLTYHYALPVYETENVDYQIPLANDYSMPAEFLPSPTFTFAFNDAADLDLHPGNSDLYLRGRTTNKFAVKWLLTGITGPDFVDVNSNNVLDTMDTGYWVRYDYAMWNAQFVERTPEYGYDYLYSPSPVNEHQPIFNLLYAANIYQPYRLSGVNGSIHVKKTEAYYLSKIKTSTHSAIFVRDIRNDEKGGLKTSLFPTAFKPTPSLLLKRIVLFKNEQLDSIVSSYPKTNFNTAPYTAQFTFTDNINTGTPFFTESWYSARPSWDYCVLRHAEFDLDYSLAPGYYGNVNVSNSTSSALSSPTSVQNNIVVSGTSTTNGKLTLKRILFRDINNVKLAPSTKFDYAFNPKYNHIRQDYWGFYKYDVTTNNYSRYANAWSKDSTSAWSLKRITEPLGKITEFDYESNSYTKVIDNESPTGSRGPAFIYRIKEPNVGPTAPNAPYPMSIGASFDMYMEEGSSSANTLNEFVALKASSLAGMKKKICIPYYTMNGSQCGTPGFMFGDVNNLSTVAPNSSEITGTIVSTVVNDVYNMTNQSYSNPTCSVINPDYFQGIMNPGSPSFGYTSNYYQAGSNPLYSAYSGNGFLMFETPVGYEAYGGGVRVKRIKTSNAASEQYVKEYTYENGVATKEMDRFDHPILRKGSGPTRDTNLHAFVASAPRYNFLEPMSSGRFSMSPQIGYSKVTVRDLGRINTDNGRIETSYITDPAESNNLFNKNYELKGVASYVIVSNQLVITGINECINIFSNVFGKEKQSNVYDKSGSLVTKTINEYALSQQGTTVENFHFKDDVYYMKFPDMFANNPGTASSSYVNISRDIPVVLKSTTIYGNGNSYAKSDNLLFDDYTGDVMTIQTSGRNKGTTMTSHLPAYRLYGGYSYTSPTGRMGLPLFKTAATYKNVDSTISTSPSFLSAENSLYSQNMLVHQYLSGIYQNNVATLPYYTNNRLFDFNPGVNSLNDFGLYDKSALTANPLNYSTINSSTYFEPATPTTYNFKLTNEITLIDWNNHVLEQRDAHKRFTANRYDVKGIFKTASAGNCNFASFTFSGFEHGATTAGTAAFDGDLLVNGQTIVNYTTLQPHTGTKCIAINTAPVSYSARTSLSPSGTLQTGLMPGRTYRASVWIHNTNKTDAVLSVTVSGQVSSTAYNHVYSATYAGNLVTTIGNWNLVQMDVDVPDNFTTSGGPTPTPEFRVELKSGNTANTVYFDDFVLHPAESGFSASVYNQRNGRLMSLIDENGLATNYVYDEAGNITEVWKEILGVGYKQVEKHSYNYARGANN